MTESLHTLIYSNNWGVCAMLEVVLDFSFSLALKSTLSINELRSSLLVI